MSKDSIVDREPRKKVQPPRYTKDEDKLILDIVQLYPDNLKHGFRQAALKLKDRKICSISSRYYYLIKSKKTKGIIVTGSAVGFSANKNTQSKNGKLMRKEPLRPLTVVFKQLLDLNPSELKKIKEFINAIE